MRLDSPAAGFEHEAKSAGRTRCDGRGRGRLRASSGLLRRPLVFVLVASVVIDVLILVLVATAAATTACIDVALLALLANELVVFLRRAAAVGEVFDLRLTGGADLSVVHVER